MSDDINVTITTSEIINVSLTTNDVINVTLEGGIIEGTNIHSNLSNLDFDSSGHTGFASEIDLTTHTNNTSIHFEQSQISITTSQISDYSTFIETDPIFSTSEAFNITSTDITNLSNLSGTNSGDQSSSDFDIKDLTDSTDLRTIWSGKQDALGFTPENIANKGQNNGYASLDSGGKIPVGQLPASVMHYLGIWNANTNTPTIADSGSFVSGDIYLVSVAGTQDLGSGEITFSEGDWVVYNGTIWEKSINSNAVVSVNSQTGVVSLDTDNISEGANKYYSSGLFDTDFATKSTTDLSEGTNLYYEKFRTERELSGKTFNDGVRNGGVDVNSDGIVFDGTDDYITINFTDLNNTNAQTISGWFKKSNNDDFPSTDQFKFLTQEYLYFSGRDGGLRFGTGSDDVIAVSKTTYPLNEWNYLVGVWDGTKLLFYVNGNLIGEKTTTLVQTSNTSLNRNHWGGQPAVSRYFNGSSDSVALYSRALSAGEIEAQYDAGRGAYAVSGDGLVAQYTSNDYNTTHVFDTNHLKPTFLRVDNWDSAYDWGNHADEGYLTSFTESDPVWESEKAGYFNKTTDDTDNIIDTETNRFTNDTDITRLANTSGTNTGDQDLNGLVPYTGATGNVDLGAYDLTAHALDSYIAINEKLTFDTNLSNGDMSFLPTYAETIISAIRATRSLSTDITPKVGTNVLKVVSDSSNANNFYVRFNRTTSPPPVANQVYKYTAWVYLDGSTDIEEVQIKANGNLGTGNQENRPASHTTIKNEWVKLTWYGTTSNSGFNWVLFAPVKSVGSYANATFYVDDLQIHLVEDYYDADRQGEAVRIGLAEDGKNFEFNHNLEEGTFSFNKPFLLPAGTAVEGYSNEGVMTEFIVKHATSTIGQSDEARIVVDGVNSAGFEIRQGTNDDLPNPKQFEMFWSSGRLVFSTTGLFDTYMESDGSWAFRRGTTIFETPVEIQDDLEVDGETTSEEFISSENGKGLIVTSPDGNTTKRIGIDNDGNIVVEDL